MINLELKRLLEQFPLPKPWTTPELHSDILDLGNCVLITIGLVASTPGYPPVTASAVGIDESPFLRAYFELIERISICLIERSEKQVFLKTSFNGQEDSISRLEVFPQSPNPKLWVFSRSNGVSAQVNYDLACRSSALELIERDVVLRSWQGETSAIQCQRTQKRFPQFLEENYIMNDYFFNSQRTFLGKVFVCGTFGFPIRPELPFLCGFGASLELNSAIERAYRESLQRLGFLWDDIPPELVRPSPTPEFHLDYYWKTDNHLKIKKWLEHRVTDERAQNEQNSDDLYFIDITPTCSKAHFSVVKCISNSRLPLYFGSQLQGERIHPIA